MKTSFLLFVLLYCISVTAQIPTTTDSAYGTQLINAGGVGKMGIILSSTAPIWVIVGINNPKDLSIFAAIGAFQAIVGTILQYRAWNLVQYTGKKMGGQYLDTNLEPQIPIVPVLP